MPLRSMSTAFVLLSGNGSSGRVQDRKSTRLNSSHGYISYAVFCLKKKKLLANHLQTRDTYSLSRFSHSCSRDDGGTLAATAGDIRIIVDMPRISLVRRVISAMRYH